MHFIVAVPLDKELASFIGKKGSENSITFYNRVYNDDVVVALMPSNMEEKPYGLAQSLLLSSQIIISTSSIDKNFGEVLVASGLLERRVIFTNENEIGELAKSAGIRAYSIHGKEEILDKIVEFKPKEELASSRIKRVDIDKSFVVRGVGTVVLGIVTSGSIAVHDTLYAPNGKEVFIRSIQSQDRDIESAPLYTRVGLAVKGIEYDEVEKGDIFSNEQIKPIQELEAEIKQSEIVKEELKEGSTYGFAINFSYTSCTIKNVEGKKIKISLDKPVPFAKGDQFFLIRQRQPRLFASGVVL
jgi:selenocysteine-specific translation elongation factor